jgi:hypothetical protein
MILFSRKFVRRRAISLATSASVAQTSFALAQDPSSSYHLHVLPVQYVANRSGDPDERPVLSQNDAAMNKMVTDMVIKPSGDVDRDFVTVMAPYHQGAIDMTQGVLSYVHTEDRAAAETAIRSRACAWANGEGSVAPFATNPAALRSSNPPVRSDKSCAAKGGIARSS